ncbi:MAG: hypothetical protein WD532_01410 [Acidimicrobiia bacterium]
MYDTETRASAQTTVIQRHPIVSGAVLGLGWGVAMRAWMRFISADPEFSWSGTLFILGASVICGTVLGLAWHRRAVGGAGWWRLSFGSLALLGAGGAVMWPAVILGAIALGRPRPAWLRALLGVGAIASQVPVIGGIADNWRFDVGDVILASVWYAPMLAFEMWAFSVAFRPSIDGSRLPARIRNVLIAAGVPVVGLIFLSTVGFGGSDM